ncbi:pre-mRNA 3'-end-processing factor FIP1 isoform X3 [Coregonus clupeaformis]|uniref:pre-mRNA 3'-end-processing factor FIP1 isoform X3 n=1 Tax=Coregonus clupeaformis TaxID=59861 RepID=UPI001E1C2E8F|nr:pre-mRNA 3'-end-processing factor FIP1 isoform X3 [Coregonus clupeaformis]
MSAEEAADKTTPADASAGDAGEAGDEEEEWLYGDDDEKAEEEEAKLTAAVSAPAPESDEAVTTGNGVEAQEKEPGDDDSDSDSDDDDDDVRVTIGDIKTGAPQYTTYGVAPVNLNIKTAGARPYGTVGNKLKGVDLEAPGNINGVPVLEVDMESFEEKPWRKPGADLSDYFNYGFNEDTWKAYCDKQKRLRMGLEVVNISSTTSKITVQQGRTGNEKEVGLPIHTSKPDFPSPASLYKSSMNMNTNRISPPQWTAPPVQDMSYYTKPSGTIDVIGGGTATISRVEGRRRHNLEGNNIQVISEHSSSDAEQNPNKMPPFFPPGPLPPNIPPPPFLPPPPNVSQAPPLIPPPRIPMNVPPPGFPPPSGPPPSLIPTLDSGHPGGYDGRPVPPYPFPTGGFPPPMSGGYPPPMPGAVSPWPPMMDQSKQWDYYPPGPGPGPRLEDKREKGRERPRERPHEREREREHSPSAMAYNSDEERYRGYREYQAERGYSSGDRGGGDRGGGDRGGVDRGGGDRGGGDRGGGGGGERHRERSSREKEERHRERRHREKEEGRHKSSRSSSRRRHDSEEGDGHRRHKHKKSKRSKEGKEPGDDLGGDQENQDTME